MHRYLTPVRDLDALTDEQCRFLGGVAARIPKLFEVIEAGGSSVRYKLGTRRLDDGRRVELELVARVPERKWEGVAKTWGQMPWRSSADDKEQIADFKGCQPIDGADCSGVNELEVSTMR